MDIHIELVQGPITNRPAGPASHRGRVGAVLVFEGIVRESEAYSPIAALEYEAYDSMALTEMRRILNDLAVQHPCQEVRVIHRIGRIPVGESAIRVEVRSSHRREALHLLAAFMNRLKEDVPIWKARAVAAP